MSARTFSNNNKRDHEGGGSGETVLIDEFIEGIEAQLVEDKKVIKLLQESDCTSPIVMCKLIEKQSEYIENHERYTKVVKEAFQSRGDTVKQRKSFMTLQTSLFMKVASTNNNNNNNNNNNTSSALDDLLW